MSSKPPGDLSKEEGQGSTAAGGVSRSVLHTADFRLQTVPEHADLIFHLKILIHQTVFQLTPQLLFPGLKLAGQFFRIRYGNLSRRGRRFRPHIRHQIRNRKVNLVTHR